MTFKSAPGHDQMGVGRGVKIAARGEHQRSRKPTSAVPKLRTLQDEGLDAGTEHPPAGREQVTAARTPGAQDSQPDAGCPSPEVGNAARLSLPL